MILWSLVMQIGYQNVSAHFRKQLSKLPHETLFSALSLHVWQTGFKLTLTSFMSSRLFFALSDGADCYKRGMDQGFQSGYQKRNRDVLSWAKKKKKIIFREDLLSYLAGRSPPRRNHEARHTLTTAVGSNEMILPSGVGPDNVDSGAQWCPFNAFATRPEINTSAFFATGGGLGSYHCPRRRSHSDANFSDTESREGRKRSACSTDITMESPSHKRNRYF